MSAFTYTCANCKGTFTGHADGRAEKEFTKEFGRETRPDDAVVCDDCYKQIMEWDAEGRPERRDMYLARNKKDAPVPTPFPCVGRKCSHCSQPVWVGKVVQDVADRCEIICNRCVRPEMYGDALHVTLAPGEQGGSYEH